MLPARERLPLSTVLGIALLACTPLSDPGLQRGLPRAGEALGTSDHSGSVLRPVARPHDGGAVLLKLRRTPDGSRSPEGRREVGLGSLDLLLERFGAHVFPAFPFDRTGTRDPVGLARWVVVEIPEGVNFYEAVSLLRSDRFVYPESYLPLDASWLRVARTGAWPTPLDAPRDRPPDSVRLASRKRGFDPPQSMRWDHRALGTSEVWSRSDGSGVLIAVVDTGVDTNHISIAPNLRAKAAARLPANRDGNGVPGDEIGVNLAHLAIARGSGAPRLALGLLSNLSDWSGRGTAIAALAAGAGGPGGRWGVAPAAEILVVDVERNARVTSSRLVDPDPRMPHVTPPSEQAVWERAAGIAYAVAEGARVITCAWQPSQPHWVLHDALRFAESSCALAVCGVIDEGESTGAGYPVRWREPWRQAQGRGSGDVWDAWTGEVKADFFTQPLRSLLVVGDLPGADARVPADWTWPGERPVESALSNPRNDQTPLPDRRTRRLAGPAAAVGLAAGAAALVTEERPDLEPAAVRATLLQSMATSDHPSLPMALDRAAAMPPGGCRPLEERIEQATAEAAPWWKRKLKTRVTYRTPHAPPSEHPEAQDPR